METCNFRLTGFPLTTNFKSKYDFSYWIVFHTFDQHVDILTLRGKKVCSLSWLINTFLLAICFCSGQQLQPKLYLSIIEDVIDCTRELFLDEGLEDRVLDDLKQVSCIPHPVLLKKKKMSWHVFRGEMLTGAGRCEPLCYRVALEVQVDAVKSDGRLQKEQHQLLQLHTAAPCQLQSAWSGAHR